MLFNALVLEKRETVKVIELFPDDGNGSDRHVFRMVFELATIQPAVAVDMVKGAKLNVIRRTKLFNRKIKALITMAKIRLFKEKHSKVSEKL